jgi:hypothetical protein
VAIRECLSDRFAGADGEVQTSVDLSLRIWKAGWVQALAGSNPASSAPKRYRPAPGGPGESRVRPLVPTGRCAYFGGQRHLRFRAAGEMNVGRYTMTTTQKGS